MEPMHERAVQVCLKLYLLMDMDLCAKVGVPQRRLSQE